MNSSTSRSAWNTVLLAGAALLCLLLTAYWGTWSAMAVIWLRSDTYQHGLIVPLIVIWLLWRERHRLAVWTPSPTLWPALAFAALAILWLLGALTAVNAVTQFAVIAMLVCGAVAMLGRTLSKELVFPLLFLFFAVPIGDFMMPQLMEWTANFTVIALRASGIPVYREGLQFVIPSGSWSVVEACSGIRYVIASLTVGTLFAYLTYHSLQRRLVFIGVSLLVPIVANWLRAYLIVLLGHVSGNQLATGADHLIYGWVFFGLVIAIMFAIGARWSEPESHNAPPTRTSSAASEQAHSPWLVALLLAAIALAAPLTFSVLKSSADKGPVTFTQPPWQGGWRVDSNDLTVWKPAFSGAETEFRSTLSLEGQRIGLYIGFYRNQDYNRKLITSTNLLAAYQDQRWRAIGQGETELATNTGKQATRVAEVTGDGQRLRVHSWYAIGSQTTTRDMIGKLLTARSMLLGQGDDGAVVMLYAEQADAIPAFFTANHAVIAAMLDTARQTRR